MTTPRPPSDAATRAQALDVRQSFLVQAPAGSGKTELLTDRILALLPTVDEPEEIIAITFTKKAAAEMHSRVLEKLRHPEKFSATTAQLVAAALQHSGQRSWNLLDEPQRLRIQTIDSLASHIAHQLPYHARLGANFAANDDAKALYSEAARMLLADLESDAPHQPAISALLEHLDNDLITAEELLIDMLGRRDQWLSLLPQGEIDWPELRATLENNLYIEIRDEFDQGAVHLSSDTLARMLPIAQFMAAQLEADGKDHPYAPIQALEEAPEHQVYDLDKWQCLLNLLFTKEGGWRKAFNKTMGLPASDNKAKAHVEVLKEIVGGLVDDDAAKTGLLSLADLPAPTYTDGQWAVLQSLFSLLKVAAAYLWMTFQRQNSVDFIEIASRALEALGDEENPTDLLLAFDHRLSHLLVDEFQDTSFGQIRLLTRLTSGWQAGDGRTLFVVGDPMQSIYRFRKAEVSLFLEARKSGIGQIKLKALTLTDNFRSKAGIVDWVNQTFKAVMPAKDDVLAGAIRYTDAVAYHGPDETPAVHLHTFWPGGAVAEHIVQAVQDGLALSDNSTVAILGRTRRQLIGAITALSAAGIPFRAVELQALSQQLWIQDLLQLTRALLHPADRLAWLTLLRAPWCGLTLMDLDILCGDDHQQPLLTLLQNRIDQLSADGQLRASRVLGVLQSHISTREIQPFTVSVQSAWQTLGGPATLPHSAAWSDCQAYFDWLEAQDWPLNLDKLEDKLAKLYAAPDSREEAERVVVMTMHKSKGLQFDTVLMPSLEGRGNKDNEQLLLSEEAGQNLLFAPVRRRDGQDDTKLYRWLAAKEQARSKHEAGRLLYVAATRAKRYLHLFATVKKSDKGDLSKPVANSLLNSLWPVLESSCVPEGDPLAIDDEITLPPPQRLERLPSQHLQAVAPTAIYPSAHHAVVFEPPSIAAAVGSVVHAWLEQIGKDGIEHWQKRDLPSLMPLMRQQLRQEQIPTAALDSAVQKVQLALARTLKDPVGRWLLSSKHPHSASEWNWLSRDTDGRVQHQIIDRSFMDSDGQRWIVDFKTSSPQEGQDLQEFVAQEIERYQPQLRRYADLLEDAEIRLGLYFPLVPFWVELGNS